MYKILFFLILTGVLCAGETASFWWPWSTPEKPKNSLGEMVKTSRKLAYDHYQENDGASKNLITLGIMRSDDVHLDEGFNFQMVIVSYYDGKEYYEGLSQACIAHEKYTPSDEVWKEMEEKAKSMAAMTYRMKN